MTVETSSEPRVLLSTDWNGYKKILQALGDAPRVRVTYDRGRLEIMTTGHEHESLKTLMGRLLEVYMDEAQMTFQGGGAETFNRKKLDKGFEPDECYWIANHRTMLGVKRWDPRSHPPPDVAVEVEISHGLIRRLPIYAAIGVPEVWWYHDDGIEILLLQPGTRYQASPSSPNFPCLAPKTLLQFVRLAPTMPTSDILRNFRRELRQKLLG